MAAFLKFVQTNGQPVIINPDHVIYCVPDPDNEEHTRIICSDDETVFVVDTTFKKIADDFPHVHRDQMGRRLYEYE
jgi:hypothetical protein